MNTFKQHSIWLWSISIIAIGFGLLTIKGGGSVLFGDASARDAAGAYVPFVLWFNFLAGFAYILAGIAIWMRHPLAVWLAIFIASATGITFVVFGAHIFVGGAYEQRTIFAMALRTLVWITIAVAIWRLTVFSFTTADTK